MKFSWLQVALILVCVIGSKNVLQAQMRTGARALGMGGAYTAIAEGDDGAEWNPAAIAGRKGLKIVAPDIALMANGSGTMGDLLGGIPSGWNDRFSLFQKLSTGSTSFGGAVYSGLVSSNIGMSLSGFGGGTITPYDGNGARGHLTTTSSFTVNALAQAVNQSYQDLGFNQAKAQVETDKIMAHIRKQYPGATSLVLPVYNSRLTGVADAYGAGGIAFGRKLGRKVRIGLNLQLIGAVHETAYANFNQETFTDMAARVTGGTASAAMVDRVLMRLNLRHQNGTFFAGNELAGDANRQQSRSSVQFLPAADLGSLWQVNSRLSAGLVVRNLIPAHFAAAAPLDTHIDSGIAYTLQPRKLLLAADLTNLLDRNAARLNMGMEWHTGMHSALRMGLYHGQVTYGASFGRLVSVAAGAGMVVLSLGSNY